MLGYYLEVSGELIWLMACAPPRQLLSIFFQLIEAVGLGPTANLNLASFHGLPRYQGDRPQNYSFQCLPIGPVEKTLDRYQELVMNDFDLEITVESPTNEARIPFVRIDRCKYFVCWESEPPYNEFSYRAVEGLLKGLGGSYDSLFELRDEFALPSTINPDHHRQFQNLVAELKSCQSNREGN